MQEVPRLEEEAADFAWDVAPLEPPAVVRVVASVVPGDGGGPPDHMQPLYENIRLELASGTRGKLEDLLGRYEEIFSEGDHDLGQTKTEVHRIPTGDARPVRLPPRRVPEAHRRDVEEQIQQYLELGIAERCKSAWAAPL